MDDNCCASGSIEAIIDLEEDGIFFEYASDIYHRSIEQCGNTGRRFRLGVGLSKI